MRFRDYFNCEFETCEDHYIPELRSRYYRNRIDDAMEAVIKVAKENGCMVKYVDKERHEIIFDNYKYTATATLTNQYTTTSIDIKISTNHGSFDLLPETDEPETVLLQAVQFSRRPAEEGAVQLGGIVAEGAEGFPPGGVVRCEDSRGGSEML